LRIAFLTALGPDLRFDAEMKINQLIWPEDRIGHIARHGVTPEEVEEVCFGQPQVLRANAEGANPVYYVLGQT
jgi:hypothetical protein